MAQLLQRCVLEGTSEGQKMWGKRLKRGGTQKTASESDMGGFQQAGGMVWVHKTAREHAESYKGAAAKNASLFLRESSAEWDDTRSLQESMTE